MRRLLCGAALVLVCAGAALAGDWRALWRRMPEAKKNALLRAWRKWRAMPETERARLMKRWRALKAMSEGERRRLLQRARRWRRLSKEQRRRIMGKWKRWQRLRGQLVMALPEEQRRELLRMPGPRRARELRRLLHRHALDVYRALLDCMPRKQMMSLLQLPQGEFLTRMKELLKRREKVIYDALLQTLPAAERSRLAGLDERRRRVELRRLVRKRMRWRGAALRALGYGARLRRLSHVPPTLAAIEGERMWRSALMENAGRSVAENALGMLRNRNKVAVVCGKGNNAGDGFVCARHLLTRGKKVDVFLLGNPLDVKDAAAVNLKVLMRLGKKPLLIDEHTVASLNFSAYELIIDAIFGIGLKGEVGGIIREVIEKINAAHIPCLLYTSPSPRDLSTSRMPSSA